MNTEEIKNKYNINLDIDTTDGEKTYWDLREYFTKEIEYDNIIISTDMVHMCCHRTDIESIKKEFSEKLDEIIENEPGPCEDPYRVGCSNIETGEENNSNEVAPPPYK
tara:strand:- start:534 stop:857 length:324 start_codon:yes stop_codon:yes gene_type:complete